MKSTRRGYLMIELYLVLAMLGLVLFLIGNVMETSLKLSSGALKVQDARSRDDAAVDALRRDVWSADRMDLIDPTHLTLHTGDQTIQWTLAADGTATRTQDSSRQWPVRDWRFARVNGILTNGRASMVSQVDLANRETP